MPNPEKTADKPADPDVTVTELGTASALVLSLAPYVSTDDVGLDQAIPAVGGRENS
jgi:hypothetical protein